MNIRFCRNLLKQIAQTQTTRSSNNRNVTNITPHTIETDNPHINQSYETSLKQHQQRIRPYKLRREKVQLPMRLIFYRPQHMYFVNLRVGRQLSFKNSKE